MLTIGRQLEMNLAGTKKRRLFLYYTSKPITIPIALCSTYRWNNPLFNRDHFIAIIFPGCKYDVFLTCTLKPSLGFKKVKFENMYSNCSSRIVKYVM